MIDITDVEFRLLRQYLHGVCGIDVPEEKRYLFVTRLGDFMEELGCVSFSQLYGRLYHDVDEDLKGRLVEAMTTNETSFYRDGYPFDVLEGAVLDGVAHRCVEAASLMRPRLRVLSAGCSTGEEPYSIAMCLLEWLQGQSELVASDVTVHGADISSRALEAARRGVYSAARVGKHLPASFVAKYFERTAEGLSVGEEVRSLVTFSRANLTEPLGRLGPFDIVFCRNVIIYFSPALKARVVESLRELLPPLGALVLGASESLYPLSEGFRVVHEGRATYYLREP